MSGRVGGVLRSVQFSSVAQSCLTLCNCSTPGFLVHHQLKLMSIESAMPSSHLIPCRPLSLLFPIPPSIRVFSNESTLPIRWPKYWSFSFSISPFKEHQGLINFDSILKRRDITLPTKVHLVKAMVFPVVLYGCESWTVKKSKRRRIDAFEL